MTSNTSSTENVPEQLVAPGSFNAIGIRRARSRKRDATASVSLLPAAATHLQPAAVAARPEPVPSVSPIPTTNQAPPRIPTKQEEAMEEMISRDIINTANKARLEVIEQKSTAFKKMILAETKKHKDMEREAISLAEDQRQKDEASLVEARQTRKVASIQRVADTQQIQGQVSLAHHDQMQQILQDVNRQALGYFTSAPPKEDHEETLRPHG